jgi:hypothetical protein
MVMSWGTVRHLATQSGYSLLQHLIVPQPPTSSGRIKENRNKCENRRCRSISIRKNGRQPALEVEEERVREVNAT